MRSIHPELRDKLIVALDLASVEEARALVDRLGDSVSFYKIGLELAFAGGLGLTKELAADGKKVFLDLKLHDIGATVERAAAQVARLGAAFLTVHAFPQTMAAAKQGIGASPTSLLAVTVLTSYDDADLAEAGYASGVRDLVSRRALQARAAGMGGLILAAAELLEMKALVGDDLLLVTPGIRPDGSDAGDQKRVMTPAAALRAGAAHLVIGRPITRAADPRAAADAILAGMAAA